MVCVCVCSGEGGMQARLSPRMTISLCLKEMSIEVSDDMPLVRLLAGNSPPVGARWKGNVSVSEMGAPTRAHTHTHTNRCR
jgi:hypothetical protein